MTFIFFFRGGHKGWSILYHPLQNAVFLCGKKPPKATKRSAVEIRLKNLKFVDF
jgi:hypothetical protein